MRAYLAILKRFEIWLLFAVVVALVAYALRPGPSQATVVGEAPETPPVIAVVPAARAPGVEATSEPAEEEAGPLTVESVRVVPSDGGRIVELALLARAPGQEPLALDEATLVATTLDGEPVHRFFEPFAAEPVALPGEGAETVVRFWLESPAEALWLDYSGARARAALDD